jgi:polyhydroxyalkanoate synthesis regulator protein
MITLKKYSNRKIYSTKNSGLGRVGYVVLSDIRDLIRSGKNVEVLDAQTKKNVTNAVLLEVVKASTEFNNNQLHNIIRG